MPSNYPTSLDTTTSLSTAVNGLQTTLNGDHTSGTTTITVQATAGAPSAGYCYIDSEVIKYTGTSPTTLTGCTRGADGTSAASHSNSAVVKFGLVADHHNSLVTAVIGAQTKLGTNTNGASATSIDAAQLAGGSSASIAALTASGLVTGAGFRDSRGLAGANSVWLFDEQTISAGSSFTIPGAGSLPAGRILRIYWRAKTDNAAAQTLSMRFNGDSGANYLFEDETTSGTAWTITSNTAQTSARIGAAADSAANTLDWGVIEIPFFADAAWKGYVSLVSRGDPGVSNNIGNEIATGYWKSTAAITSITILLTVGNFNSGGLTKFSTYICS